MKQITLNKEQIDRLFECKRLNIDYKKSISLDIYDNQLTLNNNGTIFTLQRANFEFENYEKIHYWVADELKNMVCDHLNLNSNEVILRSFSPEETIFSVRLIPEKELLLLVCTRKIAMINTSELFEIDDPERHEQIGLYRQLGNSYYYFKWIDEE